MKIFIVGEFQYGALGPSYLNAFKSLGCEVETFDQKAEYEMTSPLTKNRYLNRLLNKYFNSRVSQELAQKVKMYRPDLILTLKGQFISPKILEEIKATTHALLFNFYTDDPFNPNPGASSEHVRKSVPFYDCYFIWGKFLIPQLKKAGAKSIEYLPFACDPDLHHLVKLTEEEEKIYGSDIAFIGNWDVEREKWLSVLEDYDHAIWGADYWKTRCKNKFLRQRWRGKPVIGDEMAKVCLASKINLNILRLQNKGAHNMRTFEIPASGGFVLAERSEEHLRFFEEGKEIACFSTPQELKEKIEYYLRHEEEHRQIADAAHREVQNHTYLHRVKKILEVYKELERQETL